MSKTQTRSSLKNYHKKLSERGYSLHYLVNLNMKLDNQNENSKKMLEKIVYFLIICSETLAKYFQ